MMKTLRVALYVTFLSIINSLGAIAQSCDADTVFSDVLFVIDNSGSIDANEYLLFEQIIVASVQKIQNDCPTSRIAIMHYGGAFGQEVSIEYDFASTHTINSAVRQFCLSPSCSEGGDDLNAAMDSARVFLNNGTLSYLPANELNIIIFSDAFSGFECEGPGAFVNCSQIDPYTAIDALKSAPFNADVTVVGAITELQAEASKLALYASPGGTFEGVVLDPNCNTTFDGCVFPRKYLPVALTDPVNATADTIASYVSCGVQVIPAVTLMVSADTTICTNFNGSANISATAIGGTPPFIYEWDMLLGFGADKTVVEGGTYTVIVEDGNSCRDTAMIIVTADSTCCDPMLSLDLSGDVNYCENFGEVATLTAQMQNGTSPIIYTWNNGLSDGAVQEVTPVTPTTYIVTAIDNAGCFLTDSITVEPITCEQCLANAGQAQDPQEICPISGDYSIFTDPNSGVVVPTGYEIVYILSNADLVVLDYSIGSRTFTVEAPGLYRVHTLIAEVTDRFDPDYLDLNIITRGQSDLFIIVNCLIDHGICADFDFAGRPTFALGDDDILCIDVENSINLCSDGLDNDGDGLIDCQDPDCQDINNCLESSFIACNDLFDNDGDGLLDCDDPDCWAFNICFEQEELCNDGIDNDGDGLIDCMDDSCTGSSACMENSPYTCVDGIDNDGDGLIDCQEAICQRFIVCAEYSAEACSDGLDNDFDGLIDCADRHCQEILNNICAPNESTLALCSDGLDNDGDGLLDCEDSDCGFVQLQAIQDNALDFVNVIDAVCPGNDNGSIELIGQLNSTQYQYSLNGGGNQSDPNFFNLDSGSYELTITTLTNCSISFEFTIDGADCTEICDDGIDNDGDGLTDCMDGDCGTLGFSGSISKTDPTCPNLNDGMIIIGGVAEGITYEYSVLNGMDYQSSPVFENLRPGTYQIIVRTEDGCVYREQVQLSNTICVEICGNGIDDDGNGLTDCEDSVCGNPVFSNQIITTIPSCPDLNDGTIEIVPDQEFDNYTYRILGGTTSQEPIFTNLPPGTYTVEIINENQCIKSQDVILLSTMCSEVCDNGVDDDGDGLIDCEDDDCGVLNFEGSIQVTADDCSFSSTGFIEIAGQSDAIIYEYSIDGGETFQSSREFEDLDSGTYELVISTEGGCAYETIIFVPKDDCSEVCGNGIDDDGDGLTDCDDDDCGIQGIADAITVESVTCDSSNSGRILIGGQLTGISYTYSINAGQAFQDSPEFTGLIAGSYFIIVRTESGCSYQQQVSIAEPSCDEICNNGVDDDGDGMTDCEDPDCGIQGIAEAITVESVTCDSSNSGRILIRGQLSGISYTYSINAGESFQDSPEFTGLIGGSYIVIVRTEAGCQIEQEVMIATPICIVDEICNDGIDNDGDGMTDCEDPDCGIQGITEAITVESVTCDSSNSGRILIGGQLSGISYTYSINAGESFQDSPEFTGLIGGSYVVIVRTEAGCQIEQEVMIATPICIVDEICNDGIDNDGDGMIDCDDVDCGIQGISDSIVVMSVTCDSSNSGSILIRGQLSRISYTYSMNDGESFQDSPEFTGLIGGSYIVIVRTEAGCQIEQEVMIATPICIVDEICDNGIDDDGDGLIDCLDPDCGPTEEDFTIEVLNATCGEVANGSIMINPNDLSEEYSYSLNNGEATQDSGIFLGLGASTGSGTEMYTVLIENQFGCSLSIDLEVPKDACDFDCTVFDPVEPFVNDATCPDNNNGVIIYDGPSAGLTFSLDNVDYQELALFEGLDSGSYTLYVQNEEGCIEEFPVQIEGGECEQESGFFNSDMIKINIFLEGAYSLGSGEMSTRLYDLGYLPGQKPSTFFGEPTHAGQPFNQAPWFYAGTEGVDVSEKDLYTETVVDWILVSFRSTESKSSVFWKGAGLLHKDGSIQLIDEPSIDLIENRTFYILVEHRNHLPAMSPYKLSPVNGQLVYDFSLANSYRAIIGTGQKKMVDGTYVMVAGNGDVDTELSSYIDINVRDLTVWLDLNGANSSYFIEDYDLNGDINIKDRILWEANNGIFSTISYR